MLNMTSVSLTCMASIWAECQIEFYCLYSQSKKKYTLNNEINNSK